MNNLACAHLSISEKFYSAVQELLHFLYNFIWSNIKEGPIKVLYHSDHFIVIDKQPDVLLNSDDPEDKDTVHRRMKAIFPHLANPKLVHDFYFIHRLDYATSGVLCFPKSKPVARQASLAFEKRNVEKYYLAILRGIVSEEFLEINLAIGPDNRPEYENIRMAVETMPYVGQTRSALTRLVVLEKGLCFGYPATKVLLHPKSGRRHQLRLHANALGHTIVGDFTYSNRKDVAPHRMFLHAFRLVLCTKFESIDVSTEDPFSSDVTKNRWVSSKKLRSISEGMNELKRGRHYLRIEKLPVS